MQYRPLETEALLGRATHPATSIGLPPLPPPLPPPHVAKTHTCPRHRAFLNYSRLTIPARGGVHARRAGCQKGGARQKDKGIKSHRQQEEEEEGEGKEKKRGK